MLNQLIAKVIGSKNDRDVKRIRPLVEQVNALETEISGLSDEALCARTPALRSKVAGGDTLDALVARAIAGATQGVMQVATTRPQNQTLKTRGNDQSDRQDQ